MLCHVLVRFYFKLKAVNVHAVVILSSLWIHTKYTIKIITHPQFTANVYVKIHIGLFEIPQERFFFFFSFLFFLFFLGKLDLRLYSECNSIINTIGRTYDITWLDIWRRLIASIIFDREPRTKHIYSGSLAASIIENI